MTEARKNSVCAESTSSIGSFQFGLDAILVRIGVFGKFQLFNYLLICIPMLFRGIFIESYIFLASSVVYRCRVPECDGPNSTYQEPWTEFSIPTTSSGDLSDCLRYVPFNRSSVQDFCFAQNFDQSTKERCGMDFIFRDKEVTISNDFGIYCSDEWKLSMVGTVHNLGKFIGIPLGGYVSDRYGRRTILAVGGFLSAIVGVIRSFSMNYYMFLSLGFLDNVFSGTLYATIFILGLELVGQKARVLSCTLLTVFTVFGKVSLAIAAKMYPNWRTILQIFYTPALAHIILLWILPESVRWLLSQGEEVKAAQILQKAAHVNKRKLSDLTIERLLVDNRQKLSEEKSTFPIRQCFKALFWRIFNCALCWFTHVLVYYGLSLNSISLGGNKYDNFMLMSLIEIPGLVMPFWTMDRFGRRYSLFGCLIVCGICLSATILVESNVYGLQLALFLIGKLSITASFQVLYFFTSEIFPTNVRNSLLSFCSMFGRIGSMVAPQTPLMAKYFQSGPAILFSACAFISAFIALSFPETTDAILPTTMHEAEDIGQKRKHIDSENNSIPHQEHKIYSVSFSSSSS
ncbi:solute carrier family 22 member 7-like [Eupeodes corollae]|uniref:solute carrier family 22 member 7-like n=1 Tax=Eupeodes corollae TaxID=290404 RepID=UPI002493876D|nr:solute carrier family 22 member 7-like [Eupeodes corollae]XP_055906950.1 solute carrier family 22 member 7-like [Eupeodes corollae]